MLYAGEGKTEKPKFIETIGKARNNNIKVGMYWKINGASEEQAFEQVNAVSNFVEGKKNELKLDMNFYFEISNNDLLEQYSIMDKFCKNMTIDCGIILSENIYNNKYKDNFNKINIISRYWINSYVSPFKPEEQNKVELWDIDESVEIGGVSYKSIQKKS